MNDDRDSRLPKWARDEMRGLRERVQILERKRAEMLGEADTDTFLSDLLDEHPLPKGNGIIFYLHGKGAMYRVRCDIVREKNDVYLQLNAGDAITIEPRAGNDVRIRVARLSAWMRDMGD